MFGVREAEVYSACTGSGVSNADEAVQLVHSAKKILDCYNGIRKLLSRIPEVTPRNQGCILSEFQNNARDQELGDPVYRDFRVGKGII